MAPVSPGTCGRGDSCIKGQENHSCVNENESVPMASGRQPLKVLRMLDVLGTSVLSANLPQTLDRNDMVVH